MDNYSGNGEKFCHVENDKTVVDGADIRVAEYNCDCDTGRFTITATFRVGGVEVTDIIGYDSNLTKNLENSGYIITSKSHEQHLKLYIQEQIQNLGVKFKHSTLGWIKSGEHLFFNAFCSIASKTESSYGGNLSITPRIEKNYRRTFNALICGNTPLEFACVMGVSGCVVGYLNSVGESIDTLLYDIYGNTTTGKTTSVKLAVSMCGNPCPSGNEQSLFGSCLTTKRAITARLNGNNGFFVAFDELDMIGKADLTDLVYSIPSGYDKSGCQVTGEIRPTEKWNTAVAFTGEHSVLESTNQKDGLQMRTVSLGNISWTINGTQAREVTKFFRKNYGVVLPIVAKYLSMQNPDLICQEYEDEVDRIMSILPNDKLSDRKATKLAVIVLTAKYIKAAMNLNIDVEAIELFALKHAFSPFESEDQRALEYVRMMCHENANFFEYRSCGVVLEDNNKHMPTERYIGYCENGKIVVLEAVLIEWFRKGGFTNHKAIRSKWRENGILEAPKDRLYKTLKIRNRPEKVNVLLITPDLKDGSWVDQFNVDYNEFLDNCKNSVLREAAKNFKEALDNNQVSSDILDRIINSTAAGKANIKYYIEKWSGKKFSEADDRRLQMAKQRQEHTEPKKVLSLEEAWAEDDD